MATVENGQRTRKIVRHQYKQQKTKLLGQQLNRFLDEENIHSSSSCFILGAPVPYAPATPQAPCESQGLRTEVKLSGVLILQHPLCIYVYMLTSLRDSNRGFKLVVRGPKRHLRPQFPPCGIKELWVSSLWGHGPPPLKTCWRRILTPPSDAFPH